MEVAQAIESRRMPPVTVGTVSIMSRWTLIRAYIVGCLYMIGLVIAALVLLAICVPEAGRLLERLLVW